MFWTRFEDMKIGSAVCDMHYGLPNFEEFFGRKIEVKHIKLDVSDGDKIITQILLDKSVRHFYTNKMLVCIEFGETIQFAYSYDNRILGFVTVKLLY